jgi:RHS repeat-associated protein
MTMPGRQANLGSYRYGFQNQETDPEMLGGSVAFNYRIHDPRIGRFLSVDPLSKEYPWNSSYAFAENNVIAYIDLEGLEKMYAADGLFIGQYGNSNEIKIVYDEEVNNVKTLYKAYIDARVSGDDVQVEKTAKSLRSLIASAEVMRAPITNKNDVARDWAKRYNGKSIKEGLEYGGYIFAITIDGKKSFSYLAPTKGSDDGFHVDPKEFTEPSNNNEIVAMIHSHGNGLKVPGSIVSNNKFSGDDYNIVRIKDEKTGINPYFYDQYLVTPKGSLETYDRDYPEESARTLDGAGTFDYDKVYEYSIGKGRGIQSSKPYEAKESESE